MIPIRFDYVFLTALAGLTVAWAVQGLEPWWVWLFFWLTFGAFLLYRGGQQLRRDLRFARGGKRASRDYPAGSAGGRGRDAASERHRAGHGVLHGARQSREFPPGDQVADDPHVGRGRDRENNPGG